MSLQYKIPSLLPIWDGHKIYHIGKKKEKKSEPPIQETEFAYLSSESEIARLYSFVPLSLLPRGQTQVYKTSCVDIRKRLKKTLNCVDDIKSKEQNVYMRIKKSGENLFHEKKCNKLSMMDKNRNCSKLR